jgi:predicted ABC-type ATPase
VYDRVQHGGHDVPERDIRRRYGRSLRNLPAALELADEAVVFDNTGSAPILVAVNESDMWSYEAEKPAWFVEALAAQSPA